MRHRRAWSALGLLSIVLTVLSAPRAWAFGTPYVVKDINPGSEDSSPSHLVAVGSKLFFVASDGVSGNEPWVSDGSSGGTSLLADIVPGYNSSIFANDKAVGLGSIVLFPARNSVTFNSELWKSDGTIGGTALIYPDVTLYDMARVGNAVFFSARPSGSSFLSLYKSDGTQAGTSEITGVAYLGPNGTYLTDVGGVAYFPAADDTHGGELWRSDGTAGGTAMVKDIYAGGFDSHCMWLTAVNGLCFFNADDGTGLHLWRSDGSSTGTFKIGGAPTSSGSLPGPQLADLNGTAVAIVNDGVHGAELWKSDGTLTGTVMIKDINPGAVGGLAQSGLVVIGPKVYFPADDGVHGSELWQSDGTEAGTVMVKDIVPGSYGSSPRNMADVNGTLFFLATDNSGGSQPWTSDGTDGGTTMLANLIPGGNSQASGFTYAGSLVYFAATDVFTNGLELWAVGEVTAVGDPAEPPHRILSLAQNEPNPFRATTSISYSLPTSGWVRLEVFDLSGREVETVVNEYEGMGTHRIDLHAEGWANGIYFYRLRAGDRSLDRKLILAR